MLDFILNNLVLLIFIVVLLIDLIVKKFNILKVWTERNGKPSWLRIASTVILYYFIKYLQASNVDYKVVISLGILIFFPKLLQKIVENWKEK